MRRTGIASFFTRSNRRAASIASKTWPRLGSCPSTSPDRSPQSSSFGPATARLVMRSRWPSTWLPRPGPLRQSPSRSGLRGATATYRASRGSGITLLAGFPWFTDWGRDTFIALRGLLVSLGELDAALAVLTAWSQAVSQGMMPNRFPDAGAAPRIQCGRCLALVRRGRPRRSHGGGGRRAGRAFGNRGELANGPARPSSTAMRGGRATGSEWIRMGSLRRVSPACSSPGWMPRSAIGS